MAGDNDLTAAFLKQFSEVDNTNIDPESVEFDEESLRLWLRIKEACNHFDIDFEKVREQNTKVQMLEYRARNLGVNEAVNEDDITRMSAIKGTDSDDRIDATGYDKLLDLLKPAAQQVLVKGSKGSGKTVKVLTMAAVAVQEGIVDKVMMNIKTKGLDPEIKHIEVPDELDIRFGENISDFLEFAKEDGEKLIVGDELSTVANALGGHSEAQDIFPRVINALRKSVGGSTRLMYVGHNHDTDILPTLKYNADVVIYAEGKKEDGLIDKLSVYRTVGRESAWEKFQDDEYDFKIKNMEDIPEDSPWAVDTNYFAHLEFNLDDPEKQIQRGKIIDDWQQYQDDDDGAQSQEEVIEELLNDTCKEEECPNGTYEGTPYCYSHLRQAINDGEYGDIDLEEGGESADEDDKGGFDECRACDRTVGVDMNGFCPDHDEGDLD